MMTPGETLVERARFLASSWRRDLDLSSLIGAELATNDVGGADVVAIGKAAGEMASAACTTLGERVARALVICDDEGSASAPRTADVVIGTHPLPDERSARAGAHLIDFLASSTSDTTVILISGGASSLCVVPAPPLSLDDLHAIFRASLEHGVDITTLNRLRAATSMIGGGAVLGHLRTRTSQALIMVDNVISGPEWVASALTYEFWPARSEVLALIDAFGLARSELGGRIIASFEYRRRTTTGARVSRHVNRVVAEPAMMLASIEREAAAQGFEVRSLGARIHDDVSLAARQWADALGERTPGVALCVLGVGEVALRIRGAGTGGRCQHFALTMADAMAEFGTDGDAAFVAIASDGRDFVDGVAGAWVERATMQRAQALGVDVQRALGDDDSNTALARLGQLIAGEHTGWNLCDVYLAVADDQR